MRKIELQETNFKKPRYSQLTVDIHLPTLLKRDPHSLDQLFCDNKTLNLPRFRFFVLFLLADNRSQWEKTTIKF